MTSAFQDPRNNPHAQHASEAARKVRTVSLGAVLAALAFDLLVGLVSLFGSPFTAIVIIAGVIFIAVRYLPAELKALRSRGQSLHETGGINREQLSAEGKSLMKQTIKLPTGILVLVFTLWLAGLVLSILWAVAKIAFVIGLIGVVVVLGVVVARTLNKK